MWTLKRQIFLSSFSKGARGGIIQYLLIIPLNPPLGKGGLGYPVQESRILYTFNQNETHTRGLIPLVFLTENGKPKTENGF
jgi:hypothetical protein